MTTDPSEPMTGAGLPAEATPLTANPRDFELRQTAIEQAEGWAETHDPYKYDPYHLWRARAAHLARWVRILQKECQEKEDALVDANIRLNALEQEKDGKYPLTHRVD